eukprot:434902_1
MSRRIVERKDMTRMSSNELNRFFNAVDTMMISRNGPGTSDFFRIASYHGQPAPIYCEHGRETFPGWHRIYLMEFEKALQKADINNGNDGRISLPYWDWTQNIRQGLPDIIYRRFDKWPSDFWPRNLRNISQTQRLRRARDSQIASQLRSWGVVSKAQECLLITEHNGHASTQHRSMYPSIEDSHNDIHVIVGGNGGQLSSVAWAAFDICFWLHHCNVDRIYESYLKLEPDSQMEFQMFQKRQRNNLYEQRLQPFKKPNGNFYTARDTFNTHNLGYIYDNLMRAPKMQLREPPVLLMFKDVKISDFESKCYQIHAFIYDKIKYNRDEKKDVIQTIDDLDKYYDSDNYAGGVGIFGRGMECKTCLSSPKRNIIIDISKTIKKLKISRYNAIAKIYVLETTNDTNKLKTLYQTPLEQPIITGPLFDKNISQNKNYNKQNRNRQHKQEIIALQKYLKHFGYYDKDKMDGNYDDATEIAVKDFQKATGELKIDGIVGPKTRERIVNMKRCDNKDGFANNNVSDKDSDFTAAWYRGKYEFSYSIGIIPGYLKRKEVQKCIRMVCNEYTKKSKNILIFNELELKNDIDEDENENKEIDIKFNWKKFRDEDDILKWDGPGGILGKGGNGFVDFDLAERWVIGLSEQDEKELSDIQDVTTWRRGQPTISLYYTALHELGHTLGLDHSINVNDIMSPWYNPKQKELSKNDSMRLMRIAVYGQKAPGSMLKVDKMYDSQVEEDFNEP